MKLYLVAADAMLVTHALVVLFVVGGLVLVWLGHFLRWHFVRNFYFRMSHLMAIGFVAAQTLAGFDCPLTTWENNLRVKAGAEARYTEGCITHWVRHLIFYEADEKVFAVIYVAFFGLVLGSFVWIPPERPSWWRRPRANENIS
jgi:hypothetical protein